VIEGDAGNDHLTGGSGADVLMGGSGDDTLRGNDGDDILLGGDGGDDLDGGEGNDVLSGGDGDDNLNGDRGLDILIGGSGKDDLKGGNGDDLLIGGWTLYDDFVDSLRLIMAEWSSGRDYDDRVTNLHDGTGPVLSGTGVKLRMDGAAQTVINDDGEEDKLKGDSDRDWFFAELGQDNLKDKQEVESLN
jgi:Ca2+-binding RTX toxin-like protein